MFLIPSIRTCGKWRLKSKQLLTISLEENSSAIAQLADEALTLVNSISAATACQTETYHVIALQMKEIAAASQSTADSSLTVSNSLQQTQQVAQQLQASVGIFNIGT
jgi:methyl-accepting chemotaxis protein